MTQRHLTELRNALSDTLRTLAKEGQYSSRDIAKRFASRHVELIRQNQIDLIELALVKLVSDVSDRKSTSVIPVQSDLFSEFSVPSVTTVRNRENPAAPAIRSSFDTLTLQEVEAWIVEHSKPRLTSARAVSEARRLLNEVRPFSKPGMTVGQAWVAKQEVTAPARLFA